MKNILKFSSDVILNAVKNPVMFVISVALAFSACTDYSDMFEDEYGYLVADEGDDVESSGSGKSSSSTKSSSSEANDSSAKSSSSVTPGSEYDPETNTLKDLRDSATYRTVTIGSQIWMAENLNYKYIQGTDRSYCPNENADSCAKYGRLYEWNAAKNSCPDGWRLPNNNEWSTLFSTVGNDSVGVMLKSTAGWIEDGNGKDSYDFTVLPVDYSFNGDLFDIAGYSAFFWSLSTISSEAYRWEFYYSNDRVTVSNVNKKYALSVRCIRFAKVENSSSSSTAASSSSIKDDSKYDSSKNVLTDLRDGQSYKTVTIGKQTWMAENLNYAYLQETAQLDSSSFCYYLEGDSCSKYGRLYMWSAVMDSASVFGIESEGCGFGKTCMASEKVRPDYFRGVCPKGWHLPSEEDWRTLQSRIGGERSNLESEGFNLVQAGYFSKDGDFMNVGLDDNFWSSTESDSSIASVWHVGDDSFAVAQDKRSSASVRCLKD